MFALPQSDRIADVRWRRASDVAKMRLKQRALIWMLFWSAVAGFATGCPDVWDAVGCLPQVVAAVAFVSLTYQWCDADAQLRRFSNWDNFVPALYICPGPLVVVPVYIAATRRKTLVRSMSLAALYLFVLVTAAILMSGVGAALA